MGVGAIVAAGPPAPASSKPRGAPCRPRARTQFCISYSETDRVGDKEGNVHHIFELLQVLSPDPEAIIAKVHERFG